MGYEVALFVEPELRRRGATALCRGLDDLLAFAARSCALEGCLARADMALFVRGGADELLAAALGAVASDALGQLSWLCIAGTWTEPRAGRTTGPSQLAAAALAEELLLEDGPGPRAPCWIELAGDPAACAQLGKLYGAASLERRPEPSEGLEAPRHVEAFATSARAAFGLEGGSSPGGTYLMRAAFAPRWLAPPTRGDRT